ncbi:PREDICTED: bile salt sulfotransferase-like [Elephantulus edwardii]|uniref:bile salt sulfotransferase-like n=1 Tax=Elephantulus edwardii TaxID=28737 RepID=UPI0003F0EC75|nr:PREDICTED: bile salt sulfotransferase-like [Elephantulus edwardii]
MDDKYIWFEGIPFLKFSSNAETLQSVKDEFVVRDEDVIALTYPKSGSHWMVEMICLISSKGDPSWIQSVFIYDRSPWLETTEMYPGITKQEGPRIYASHLPIQLFPKSFFNSKAKVIYVVRNPRDIVVSGYHFFGALKIADTPEVFDQYLQYFLQGRVPYGSWFDHACGWMSMRERENLLIIYYEELLKDIKSGVEKISRFLGKELTPEELNSVIKHVSFESMKDNKMSNFSLISDDVIDHSKGKLMRKGIAGDWKNYFTVAQSEAFDKIFREKMAGLPQALLPWE